LEKLPADRFATAAEFVAALRGATEAGGTRAMRSGARKPSGSPMRERVLAAGLLVVTIVAGWGWARRSPELAPIRQQVLLWKFSFPDAMAPGAQLVATQSAIAPDGSSIVFVDSTPQGFVLMRKRRGSADAEPMAGTEGGVSPFFSPDGAWVGFVTVDGKVRKVPVAGGGAITLASDVNVDWKIGTWADDGFIYYASSTNMLAGVDASDPNRRRSFASFALTGTPMQLTPLPGSRGLLAAICPGNCAVTTTVSVFDLKSDSMRLLVPEATGAWYAPTGHLLYTGRDGGLYAMGFDAKRLVTTSSAVPFIPDVAPGRFALSASGDAVYELGTSGRGDSELMWVDRSGRRTPFDSTWRAHFEYPALSPDGRTLAVSTRAEVTELWLRRPNGARERVIAPGSANWRSHWTPRGDTIYFVSIGRSRGSEDAGIRRLPADLSARSELVEEGESGLWEVETSPDRRWLIVRRDEDGNSNIRYRALAGDTALRPLLVDPGQTTTLALSPNGQWLAYMSDEGAGARYNVYVAPFPSMTPRRLVSRNGGSEPRWSRDGRELFFKSGAQMMAVSVGSGTALEVGNPRALFSLEGFRGARNRQQYDVAPDGRFLMIQDPQRTQAATVVYAQGLLGELRAAIR
jgi:eukaryotic-like serine/threonine-protein kinase